MYASSCNIIYYIMDNTLLISEPFQWIGSNSLMKHHFIVEVTAINTTQHNTTRDKTTQPHTTWIRQDRKQQDITWPGMTWHNIYFVVAVLRPGTSTWCFCSWWTNNCCIWIQFIWNHQGVSCYISICWFPTHSCSHETRWSCQWCIWLFDVDDWSCSIRGTRPRGCSCIRQCTHT